jgi:hypothetical protein
MSRATSDEEEFIEFESMVILAGPSCFSVEN